MSWVKAVPSFGEDVFDEDMDDVNLQQKEWKSNMEKRIKDGYRDGMDAGKEASLQHGFNQGYKEGASRMGVIGQLKGILSALQSWCQLQKKDSNTTARVSHLLQEVDQQEERMTEKLKNCQQTHMGELTDIVEDIGIAKPTQEPDSESCSNPKGTDYCKSGGEAGKNCCKSQSTSSGSHKGCQPSSETVNVTQQNLGQLLRQCIDLVGELGLPAELMQHIHQLISTPL
ncbi:Yae1 domain-containing protein 1 [Acipenser ruthenus]|uniref:Yae1 domain-containing protein 1 n=1 Tax=Acipenser ruthenus TaxID=7906 RepID=A0A444UPZ0_ACIRT|nr:Yae1 domain-containing protein 1 [Acipenser ruthenus]